MTSTSDIYVWAWLPEATEPVPAGRLREGAPSRYPSERSGPRSHWGYQVLCATLPQMHGGGASCSTKSPVTKVAAPTQVTWTNVPTSRTPAPTASALSISRGQSPTTSRVLRARPKSVIHDSGRECIAKFTSSDDHFPVVGAEAASMFLAEKTGLDVAGTRVESVLGREVLLVERFDRTNNGGILASSALTLTGLDGLQARSGETA
ncbi:HipA domain-containing protein [Arthrobacter sp. Sr24]